MHLQVVEYEVLLTVLTVRRVCPFFSRVNFASGAELYPRILKILNEAQKCQILTFSILDKEQIILAHFYHRIQMGDPLND